MRTARSTPETRRSICAPLGGGSRRSYTLDEPRARRSAEPTLFRDALESLSDPVAVLDRHGRVLHINASWCRAQGAGLTGPVGPVPAGANYLDLCQAAPTRTAALVLKGVRSVLAGTASRFRHEYRCRTLEGRRCQVILVTPLQHPSGGAVIACADATRQRLAQRQVRALSRLLLAAHERERQSVARELHDDITQVIAATAIDLSLIQRRIGAEREGEQAALGRIVDRLRMLSRQVQALSHRMHPHALRVLGLARALDGECRSFAERTGIGVASHIQEGEAPLPPRLALAAFRIAQEALNNVARHARATSVRVDLEQSAEELRLRIADTGLGFDPSASRAGIGLVGMRERALAVGGRISIDSAPGRGAAITLTAPLGEGRS